MSKIQNEDIKSSAELISGGGTASQLPNDDKIYVTASGINKTLKQAIIDGDIAGGAIVDTYANIEGMTRSAGAVYFATDKGLFYGDDGASLTSFGNGSPSSDPIEFDTSAGIWMKAVTTDPAYGTIVRNEGRISRNAGMAYYSWEYEQSDNTGASNGSGVYLIKLPYKMDLTRYGLSQSFTDTGLTQSVTVDGDGSAYYAGGDNIYRSVFYIYDEDHLAVLLRSTTGTYNWWSSSFFQFSPGAPALKFQYHIKVHTLNWSAGQNIGDGSVITASYTSPEQTITSNGLLTLPHSLGKVPHNVEIYLVNQTAENGYSVGDIVLANRTTSNSGIDTIFGVLYFDATNIYLRFGDGPTHFYSAHKTTGNSVAFTNANWKLVVKALACPDNVPSTGQQTYEKYTKTYTDFSVAALTNTISLFTLGQREQIDDVFIYVKTGFSAPSLTTATIEIGDVNNSSNSIWPGNTGGSLDVLTAGQKRKVASGWGEDFASADITDFTGTNGITITLTGDVNLDTFTAGEIVVYIKKSQLSAP